MAETASGIIQALAALADGGALKIALALAAAGTVSMAVLQLIKELTPFRRVFQRIWIRGWIARKLGLDPSLADSKDVIAKLEKQLADQVTGGDLAASYGMPIEDLISQLQDSIVTILNYPRHSVDLFLLLSAGADEADVNRILNSGSPSSDEMGEEHGGVVGAPEGSAIGGSHAFPLTERDRISQRMRRNIEGLGFALGDDWRFTMHLVAVVFTVAVVEIAILSDPLYTAPMIFVGIPLGVLGSYFAPVTRDIVAALENLRRPR